MCNMKYLIESKWEEAFDRSVQFEDADKICFLGSSWDILVGDYLHEMIKAFPELQRKFYFR